MTQEEKARAYDEAIEKIKYVMEHGVQPVLTKEDLRSIFHELKESKDEMIRKMCMRYLDREYQHCSFADDKKNIEKCIAWLEKQGEQKPAAKVESKFNFKVGQWIVATGKCVYIIAKIDGFNVTLVDTNGDEYVFDASSLDDAHEWSIQDANDGDILYAKGCYFKEYLFMFSSFTEDNVISTHFGYDVFHKTFDKKLTRFGREEDFASVTPATKEQRDTLMKAMADAGYTFDFGKKELKKIEQKSAEWSEKDENILKSIIATCELAEQDRDSSPAKHLLEMQTNWLKSLKQRIHVSSAKTCENDTLLDLLQKMPSCITVDGIDYHFVMAKSSYYIAYYKGNKEKYSGNAIFGITAHSPIDLLAEMLEILKEKGLLE